MPEYAFSFSSYFILRDEGDSLDAALDAFNTSFFLFANGLRKVRLTRQPLSIGEKDALRERLEDLLSLHDSVLAASARLDTPYLMPRAAETAR